MAVPVTVHVAEVEPVGSAQLEEQASTPPADEPTSQSAPLSEHPSEPIRPVGRAGRWSPSANIRAMLEEQRFPGSRRGAGASTNVVSIKEVERAIFRRPGHGTTYPDPARDEGTGQRQVEVDSRTRAQMSLFYHRVGEETTYPDPEKDEGTGLPPVEEEEEEEEDKGEEEEDEDDVFFDAEEELFWDCRESDPSIATSLPRSYHFTAGVPYHDPDGTSFDNGNRCNCERCVEQTEVFANGVWTAVSMARRYANEHRFNTVAFSFWAVVFALNLMDRALPAMSVGDRH